MKDELLIATHNAGKAREIEALLRPYIRNFVTAADLGLFEPEENGSTFEENALIKARAAAGSSGKVALADDSGLCVNSLGGEPGIYSARWAGADKDFSLAMRKVQDELEGHEDRSAYFVCVLALAWPGGKSQTFRGEVHGEVCFPPRGDKGFGYDPIFVPEGYNVTFAEMNLQDKHAISHRARAFDKLMNSHFLMKEKSV